MKRAVEFFGRNKRVVIICALICALIITACMVNTLSDSETSTTGGTSANSSTEIKLAAVLSEMDGVGKAQVMVTENDGQIEGVIVVCEGADNIMTRNDILNAVATALNIEKNIIAVYAMN